MPCTCNDPPRAPEHQRAFAQRAMKLAVGLPDDATCNATYTAPQARFLSALRNLAAEYSLAHTWSESEIRSRSEALHFVDAALDYAFSTVAELPVNGGGGGGGGSCTNRCNNEKDGCRQGCDQDPSAGYFCYFDCRLTYMACLAGCITHGGGGGNVIL
jgi:hypothetical protein